MRLIRGAPRIALSRAHGRKAFAEEEQQVRHRPQPPSPVRRRTSTGYPDGGPIGRPESRVSCQYRIARAARRRRSTPHLWRSEEPPMLQPTGLNGSMRRPAWTGQQSTAARAGIRAADHQARRRPHDVRRRMHRSGRRVAPRFAPRGRHAAVALGGGRRRSSRPADLLLHAVLSAPQGPEPKR